MRVAYYLAIIASVKMVLGSINQTNSRPRSSVPEEKVMKKVFSGMRKHTSKGKRTTKKSTDFELASIFNEWEETVVKKVKVKNEDGNITFHTKVLATANFTNIFSLPDAIKYLDDTRPTRITERRVRKIFKNILDLKISEKEYEVIGKCWSRDRTREGIDLEQFMVGNKNTLVIAIPSHVVVSLNKCRGMLRDEESRKTIEEFKNKPKIFDRIASERSVITEMIVTAISGKYKMALTDLLASLINEEPDIENIGNIGRKIRAVEETWDFELQKARIEFYSNVANGSPGPVTMAIWSLAPNTQLEIAEVEEKLHSIFETEKKADKLLNLLTEKLKKICAGFRQPLITANSEFQARGYRNLARSKTISESSAFYVIPIGKCFEEGDDSVIFFHISLVQVATATHFNGSVSDPAPIFYYLVFVPYADGKKYLVDSIMEKDEIIYSPDLKLKDIMFEDFDSDIVEKNERSKKLTLPEQKLLSYF